MRRNFTFWKYKIREKNLKLNCIDTFDKIEKKEAQNHQILRVKSLINNKIKIIPSLKIDKSNNINTIVNKSNNNINNINNITNDLSKTRKNNDLPNIFATPKKKNQLKEMNNNINNLIIKGKKDTNNNNINNSTQKKKIKFTIPINKAQVKPLQNLNQNYVININNNINNSYQIKMNNENKNNNNINKYNDKNNNYDFAKMKIVQAEDGNKNCNTSNQKTVLTEISDISCFKSNHKIFNLNSINSFVNNDNDFLSFSDDTNLGNIKNNYPPPETKSILKKSNYRNKKIYINPDAFKAFCKEIEEKLNF